MIDVIVTEDMVGTDGVYCHSDGESYVIGYVVKMTQAEAIACKGVATDVPVKKPNGGLREWCTVRGGWPQQDSNFYVIAPGAAECIDINALYGEDCRPCLAYINACGGCWLTMFDAEPTCEPVTNLSGPMINPQLIYLGEDSKTCELPQKLFIKNPGDAPLMLSVSFYE